MLPVEIPNDPAPRRTWERRTKEKRAIYRALVQLQGGEFCAICRSDEGASDGRGLHVDHDHACCPRGWYCWNCARGLLCASCNISVRSLEHAVLVLQYLERDVRAMDAITNPRGGSDYRPSRWV